MKRLVVLAMSILAAACGPTLKPLPRPVVAELPPLPVEQLSITTVPPAPGDPPNAGPRVTLTASKEADVRVLLPALAQIAGVSLVLDSTVRGAVAVHLQNVPAIEALLAVIDAAGLTIEGEPEKPWPESVFHQVPVNVNTATAGVIAARFGVSSKLAEFIVRSRAPTIPER